MYMNWKAYACMGLNFSNCNRICYLLHARCQKQLIESSELSYNKQYSSDFLRFVMVYHMGLQV